MDKTQKEDRLAPLWAEIASALRAEVNADIFDRWFKDAHLIEATEQHITLRVPNDIYRYWIEDNYLDPLRAAVLLSTQGPKEIRFTSAGIDAVPCPEKALHTSPKHALAEEEPEARATADGINPRNTFESFVVGTNNEFAAAACRAVADNPGKAYNPLFFYGGVGLGKTHLMHAIGHHLATNRKLKVAYVTSEKFTNEFIDAIQNHTLVRFRRRYRHVDVLLIDDIHFLADKGRTQEEFFHTFNTLFDGHKQIVLTSDRPPAEIGSLEPRLVSRFEWGLTAEMQVPDVETRQAILRKKAAALGINVPAEILHFIAERIRTNVRRLEGALMRVASLISLSGKTPTPERLESLLKDLLAEEARRNVNIDQIQRRVAEHFDVRIADMTSKRRPKNIAFPRQIAMYLAREHTRHSLVEIGEAFGGRDHGTVLHAHRLVRERMVEDSKTRQVVHFLSEQLSR